MQNYFSNEYAHNTQYRPNARNKIDTHTRKGSSRQQPIRKERPKNLTKGSFTTLCAPTMSHADTINIFRENGRDVKPTRPFGYHCGFRSEPRKPRQRRKRKESPGPEAQNDRPYVRPRASARQLIHYRPSRPLSSLILPPFLLFSPIPFFRCR